MNRTLGVILIGFSLIGLLGVTNMASGENDISSSKFISVFGVGKVQGQTVLYDVIIEVKKGQDPDQVSQKILKEMGLRPFNTAYLGSEGFELIGHKWDSNILQKYNSNNEPSGINGAAVLADSQNAWKSVGTSLSMSTGTSPECPSMLKECPGPAVFDDESTVGWLSLRPGVLGVAATTENHLGNLESDIALSLRYNWTDDACPASGNEINADSVMIHEVGHTIGLGHSDDSDSMMLAFHEPGNCGLASDDVEGVTFLYDSSPNGVVSGEIKDKDGALITESVTIELVDADIEVTTTDGTYTINGVPDPVTYDIKATLGGSSDTQRVTVDGATTVDFTIDTSSDDDGGGGGGPPACHPRFGC